VNLISATICTSPHRRSGTSLRRPRGSCTYAGFASRLPVSMAGRNKRAEACSGHCMQQLPAGATRGGPTFDVVLLGPMLQISSAPDTAFAPRYVARVQTAGSDRSEAEGEGSGAQGRQVWRMWRMAAKMPFGGLGLSSVWCWPRHRVGVPLGRSSAKTGAEDR
jgi:hypothetical protein